MAGENGFDIKFADILQYSFWLVWTVRQIHGDVIGIFVFCTYGKFDCFLDCA